MHTDKAGRAAYLIVVLLFSSTLLADSAPLSYDPTPDFIAYNPNYRQLKRQHRQQLHALQADLITQQKSGRKTPCCRQVMLEAKWYIYYTADFDKASDRLETLRAMLKQPKDPHDGSQLESDGSWGCCSTHFFKKLDISVDRLMDLAQRWQEPKHSVKLLEQINSPEKLIAYLDSILISDVSKTGRDHRYEHNSALSSLTRFICWEGTWHELPIKLKLHPKLYDTLIDYEDNKLQDPDTGYWGAWYRTQDGKIIKTADLSHTFHIVHFRHGEVQRWPQIINTTLAIKDREYPNGWLEDGKMTNHHNYDVVLLFRLGFDHATAQQKKEISAQVQRMLDFCLKETLLPDGAFKTGDEDTLGAAFYFGVAFLHEIGYFSKPNRFWTEEDFPQAIATNDRITAKIRELKLDDPESLFALRLLAANKIAAGAEQKAADDRKPADGQLLTDKAAAAEKAPAYRVDRSFPQLPADIKLAEVSGVAINSRGEIHIFHRGGPSIIVLDKAGKVLRSFGDATKGSHGLRIDHDDNVWTTDIVAHTVTKHSPDGKILLTLGQKNVPGADENHFDKPTDIAFAPNGDIFISDGYGNSRVVKFDNTGKFLHAWGKKGTGEGEFNTPHAIRLDSNGNLFVGDRENDRVQVFDQNGKFIRSFGGFAPFGLFITPDDTLFVADGRAHRAMKMNLEGKISGSWGKLGPQPGNFSLPHGIAIDNDGAVYITEINGKRIQRFLPQK